MTARRPGYSAKRAGIRAHYAAEHEAAILAQHEQEAAEQYDEFVDYLEHDLMAEAAAARSPREDHHA
ncbi:hypothetical protein [Tsukamurella paurometabola]|uniref:Uncharacterized protein n=1 Tax=Tsukamurella paurometabola TaxID=2061 RepID=A0A3P8MB00_TSUPA|nr:hypothetical protein [Tsukamurella paurometabola]UEA81786.1 hypothetical protein LK411_15510 [Tsukamurella paurometabola]VDR38800.1 Uncharacterised protein [Tsukamurella paurometabola]